jgi:hypothetical protein
MSRFQGIAVVGHDSIDVDHHPNRDPGQPAAPPTALKAERRICGAMSVQYDRGCGNESVPQEFVRLVGCRDLKARTEPRARALRIPLTADFPH